MQGDKYCQRCGQFIGNYMIDNYYSLIRKKYCDDCRYKVYQEQDTFRHKEKRKLIRKTNREFYRQFELLKKENELLRKRIQEMEGGSDG